MATRSFETQPFRYQRILKPSTPPRKSIFQTETFAFNWVKRGGHSVFGSPAPKVPENPKAEHPTPIFKRNTEKKIAERLNFVLSRGTPSISEKTLKSSTFTTHRTPLQKQRNKSRGICSCL